LLEPIRVESGFALERRNSRYVAASTLKVVARRQRLLPLDRDVDHPLDDPLDRHFDGNDNRRRRLNVLGHQANLYPRNTLMDDVLESREEWNQQRQKPEQP
jgi:hypothetical protein